MNDFVTTYRKIDEDRKEEFFNKGYKKRYFFPHKIYYIPRCGVEGFGKANCWLNIDNPNLLWETILYASGPLIEEFPRELFFEDDVMWHQRHLGRIGQIASGNLIVDNERLYTLEHGSDLVQHIHFRKEYKNRVYKCFNGWHHMLLNSVLNFAVENNLKYIYSPTADIILEKFLNRKVNRELFDRTYDRDVKMHFQVNQKDGWWVIDVDKHRAKLIVPEKKQKIVKNDKKTICLFHDLERGLGHVGIDPNPAEPTIKYGTKTLEKMLTVEKEMNVKATYNVVGSYLDEVKASIQQDGHCIAFRSDNHEISRQPVNDYNDKTAILIRLYRVFGKRIYDVNRIRRHQLLSRIRYPLICKVCKKIVNRLSMRLNITPIINQLAECREADYRIKGYRLFRSKATSQINDTDLCFHKFEWLAIDEEIPWATPMLQNRIVKIPIFYDDYDMYKRNLPFDIWESKVIQRIKQSDFVAVGLHHCYAHYWLSFYPDFLEKISDLGRFKTFDEVANQVFLANAA